MTSNQQAQLPEEFGPYRLDEALEEGRMGQAYRGRRTDCLGDFGRSFVIKRIRKGFTQSTAFAKTLIEQVGRASTISHSAVVVAEDLGEEDGQIYLASEHISGVSLATVSAAAKAYQAPFPVLQAAVIGAEVAVALSQGQELAKPLAHGHLTPSNVLLTPDGEVRVTDFGLAEAMTRLPRGMVTPRSRDLRYAAPEQSGSPLVSAPADLYSLGLILYELLAACHPYDFGQEGPLAERVKKGVPRPIGEVVELPSDLAALLDRLLVVDPLKRLGSARELYEELSSFLDRSRLPRADPTLRQIVWELRAQQPAPSETESTAASDGKQSLPPSVTQGPRSQPVAQMRRILVVDDSKTIQQAFRITFALQNVELVMASRGEEALKLAGQHRPHLMFLDHDLRRGRSGYDLLEHIKGDPRLTYIPVVLCYSQADGFDAQRGVKANARLAKPFETQEILDLTDKLLKQQRKGEESS